MNILLWQLKDECDLAPRTLSVSEIVAEGRHLAGLGCFADFSYPSVLPRLGPYWWEKCQETRWCLQSVWWREPRGRRKHPSMRQAWLWMKQWKRRAVWRGSKNNSPLFYRHPAVICKASCPQSWKCGSEAQTDHRWENIYLSGQSPMVHLKSQRDFIWKMSQENQTNNPKNRNGPIFDSTLVKMVRILKANSSAKALFFETVTTSASNLCSKQAC